MSARYAVRVSYVDDSYWDDGSRWTSQTFHFDKRSEALAFARRVLAEGCEVKGQDGKVQARPSADEIRVERISTTRIKWETQSDG